MKKSLVATVLSIFAAGAQAEVGMMVGVAYNFGGQASLKNLGFTAKILSSDKEDKWVGALGVTFYPWSNQRFGMDVSAGYNFQDSAALIGYDFLKGEFQLNGGWANTDNNGANLPSGPPPNPPQAPEPPLAASDIRLKRDIHLLATLNDGLKIYSFRYLWAPTTYVGVMAQDLLENPAWRTAVVSQANGFYAVNYAMLGLRMATLTEWNRTGIASVSRHKYLASTRVRGC